MTFIKKGVVLDLGNNGDIDDSTVYSPSLIKFNNKIYMYYTCYDDTTFRIALAISDDGFNFVKKGIVISSGGAGDIDELYVAEPKTIKINNKICLYHTCIDAVNKKRIALAISDDGFNFVKKGVVIPLGGVGDIDDNQIYHPSIIKINDKIYCYYLANDGAITQIALAVSDDGFNFIKKGIVIPLGGAGDIDDNTVCEMDIISFNNKFYMYYTSDDGINSRIALAISDDGFNFVKKGVVIPLGGVGDIDENQTSHPSILKINNKIYCYHSGVDGLSKARIALAISDDGI